jgi:hypothetical protein
MLHEFNLRNGLDIFSFQEVVTEDFYPEPGYTFLPPYCIIVVKFNRVEAPLGSTAEFRSLKPLDTYLKQQYLINV